MKLTKETLKRIIKEELDKVMNEEDNSTIINESMTNVEKGKILFRLVRASDDYAQIQPNLTNLVKQLVVSNPDLKSFEDTIQKLFNAASLEFKSKIAEPVEQAKESASNIQEFNKWKRKNEDLFESYAALKGVSAANRVAHIMSALVNSVIAKEKDQKIGGRMSSDWQHHARGKLLNFMSNFSDPTASEPVAGSEFDNL